MNLLYQNGQGHFLDLNDGLYVVNANDLRNYAWTPVVINRPSGIGGSIRRFNRPVMQKMVRIGVRGGEGVFHDRMNQLLAHTEPDIHNLTPGKLWLDGQYMHCYLAVSSEIVLYSRRANFAEKELTIQATYPYWITEETKHFHMGGTVPSPYAKKYDGRYPYMYGTGISNSVLINSHYTGTPVVLTIYGSVTDPVLFIGDRKFGVIASASDGERIVIDQVERTVYRIGIDGTRESLFDFRIKEDDQFLYLPPGELDVSFSGMFEFDVTLMKQRSEPEWISSMQTTSSVK